LENCSNLRLEKYRLERTLTRRERVENSGYPRRVIDRLRCPTSASRIAP